VSTIAVAGQLPRAVRVSGIRTLDRPCLSGRSSPAGQRRDPLRAGVRPCEASVRLTGVVTLIWRAEMARRTAGFGGFRAFLVAGFALVTVAIAPPQALHAANPPLIAVDPSHGIAGTKLVIAGSGFPPDQLVALYVDRPVPYLGTPGARSDEIGAFQAHVSVPLETETGVHQICGQTGYPDFTVNSVKACAPFVVDAKASPESTAGATPSPALISPPLSVPAVLAAMVVLLALVGGLWFITRRSP